MRDSPLVSIITPSFNQGRYVEDTILSVKNQDYPYIEHIIIDGKSTDNTIGFFKKYEKMYNLLWISEPDLGQSDAINKGFKIASGDIIGWINSDDAYFDKHTISTAVNYFDKHEECDILYGDLLYINSDNSVKLFAPSIPIFFYNVLRICNFIPQPSVFFRKYILNEHHLDINFHYCMDYDLWMRIGKNHKFFYCPGLVACFRLHDTSKSISQARLFKDENLRIKLKYNSGANRSISIYAINKIVAALPLFGVLKLINFDDASALAFDIKDYSILDIAVKNILNFSHINGKSK